MVFSIFSLAGLILALLFGVLILAVFQQFVMPPLRMSYERAKLTASQGLDPVLYLMLVRVACLLILPAIGLLFGHRLIAE